MTARLAANPDRAPLKRKIAAILAADVAGYSRLVAENEERTLTELAAAREIFDGLVSRSGGRIFNTAGDSVMCEFDSAVEAVRVAIDIQDSLRARNMAVEPKRRLEFRMGLTIGDVVERGTDLLGDGVNIAARLESMAPPGGICVSRSVHEAVANKLSVGFRELGPRKVKNMPQPVHAYLVGISDGGDVPAPERPVSRRDGGAADRETSGRASRSGIGLVLAGTVAVALLGIVAGRPALDALTAWTATGSRPAEPARLAEPMRPAAPAARTSPPPATTVPPTAASPPSTTPQARGNEVAAQPRDVGGSGITTRPVASKPPAREVARTETPKTETPKTETPKPTETTRPDPVRPDPAKPPAEAARTLPADPAAAFASLARAGLLADAKSLPELYHNARWLEAKGDRPGALAAYAAAAPLAGEAIDVHLRHASLLRAVRGAAAVRQAFEGLSRTNPSDAAAAVLALSAEPAERRASLEAFADAHPGPVGDFLLSEALADARDGGPTLTERRLAFESVDRFLDAASSGDLDGRFVDRAVLEGWLDAARRRRGEIEGFFASAQARPSATFTRTASGWLARIALPEPATDVTVKLGERGGTVQPGPGRAVEARAGRTATSPEVELPSSLGRTTLYVVYRDRSGREAGPFPIAFDPGLAVTETGRAALERFPDSWVAFRADLPDVLSYAGLVSNRCAISRAAIGYGDDPPRQPLSLPPCDATGPTTMPSGATLIRLPEGTDSVQVQLTFADGSESQVRTFRRP